MTKYQWCKIGQWDATSKRRMFNYASDLVFKIVTVVVVVVVQKCDIAVEVSYYLNGPVVQYVLQCITNEWNVGEIYWWNWVPWGCPAPGKAGMWWSGYSLAMARG